MKSQTVEAARKWIKDARRVVALTGAGRDTLRRANQAGEEAERRFLSPLDPGEQELFKKVLRALLSGP